jgi:hypothetical protein
VRSAWRRTATLAAPLPFERSRIDAPCRRIFPVPCRPAGRRL